MGKIYPSILSLIGETPIVKLNSVVPETSAEVYVKLEFFNPGGSVKDRIARSMIEAAEKEGRLKAGDTIVEPTSGNTGVGLAMVGAAKGYPVIIVMPDTMSVERRKLIQAYGATLILTPGSEGMKGAIAKASELASQEHFFMPLQFDNPANTAAHRETTAKEIQEAFGPTGLYAFVAGIGTGGTITGVGQELRRTSPRIKIYAVEPEESPVLKGGKHSPHKIQGIGAGFVPEILDTTIYDHVLSVSSETALQTAREVAAKEGILVGISAGAAIHSAIQVAGELGPDKKVLAVVPDNGERYLSTALYQIEE
ncbi:cysteine synthase A [Enterococcus malodoratus]|uniref:Cysteine synthase n=1 Tax=Enterococcus malodoratus ATCC 43197 TaxID=1158601 RepID=R2NP97_9ENTE|nr:cysteine synthase A [Enterococcus malodoratus]EOH72823.1 cysteine synthase A [Enterococcus malodoratus ATCC 43197]EOT67371.1 cysteine synthase A [Enterococcus malodoratus ATCC 43197]OJG59232.1 cysteine synthase A [Enterococcus malodoratus]SPX03171.1 cysteine synthase A [Enterococcus malodoratus]STD69377.1 cysteine synthase A [Enterococcus malodoratus]